MSKGLASRLQKTLEHRAKLILNKASHILSMIDNIVFHNSGKHSTQSAFIIKPIHLLKSFEICISTLLL